MWAYIIIRFVRVLRGELQSWQLNYDIWHPNNQALYPEVGVRVLSQIHSRAKYSTIYTVNCIINMLKVWNRKCGIKTDELSLSYWKFKITQPLSQWTIDRFSIREILNCSGVFLFILAFYQLCSWKLKYNNTCHAVHSLLFSDKLLILNWSQIQEPLQNSCPLEMILHTDLNGTNTSLVVQFLYG